MKYFLIFIAVLAAIWFLFWHVPTTGWHHVTSTGDHVGYVTSVETTGLFFKTHTAYIKTDTQSSQEDSYCVIDNDVFNQLDQYAKQKAHVDVTFIDFIIAGTKYCNGETGIITSVTPTGN